MPPAGDERERFETDGYLGPVRLFSAEQCRQFLSAAADPSEPAPLTWHKGRAARSQTYHYFATQPAIVEVVELVLGADFMLWGASLVDRSPRMTHPWHSDIESCGPIGRTVSVWVGLENTTRESSLQLIPRSHRFGVSVQQVRKELGVRREDATNENVVAWALRRDARSGLAVLEMGDGDAVFFDGRLWHGSNNLSEKTRRALLLQYSTPETVIRIPDPNVLDWPFRQFEHPRPPCVMVRGADAGGANRVVRPVWAEPTVVHPRLSNQVCRLKLPLPRGDSEAWKPYPFFEGSTANLRNLSSHASTLRYGHSPHAPHRHEDEELLLLLAGEVDLLLPDLARDQNARVRMKAGQFVYYPADFAHSLETVSEEPANYLMFRWWAGGASGGKVLGHGRFELADAGAALGPGFRTHVVFEGATDWLSKLHCHTSTLAPGAEYAAHVDAHDVAIVVLEGEVETLGERARPHDVILYPAGEPHGMRNPGATTAKYIVFEFHGSPAVERTAPSDADSLGDELRGRSGRLRRMIRRLWTPGRDRRVDQATSK